MTAILHNLPAPRTIDECLYPSRGGPEGYDAEMDAEPPLSPTMLAELNRLAATKAERSPEQNVEWALAEYEKNYCASAGQRWPGQERWQGRENEEARLVRIMHPHTFIRLLRRAGVDARIRDERYGRLWLNDFAKRGRVGVTAWVKGEVKTVTSLQDGAGPEWSIMRFNEYNVPTEERFRGWRTALLSLIAANVISEDEAHRAFGRPEGAASHFYLQQLKGYRAIRMGFGS